MVALLFLRNTPLWLAQTEEVQDLARLRRHLVDTTDARHEQKLGFGLHEIVAELLGLTAGGDERLLHVLVLLDVGLSLLEDRLAADLGRLLDGERLLGTVGLDLLERLALLQDGLGNFGGSSLRSHGRRVKEAPC